MRKYFKWLLYCCAQFDYWLVLGASGSWLVLLLAAAAAAGCCWSSLLSRVEGVDDEKKKKTAGGRIQKNRQMMKSHSGKNASPPSTIVGRTGRQSFVVDNY